MCYTITTKYVRCSHRTDEFHECTQIVGKHQFRGEWRDDDSEHDLLKIQRTKTSQCPKCSGRTVPFFELPGPGLITNMPVSLQPGHHLFQEICQRAYNAWIKDIPITGTNIHRALDRRIIETFVDKTTQYHALRGQLSASIVHPLPLSIRNSLYPIICQELFVMAAKARYDLKEAAKRSHIWEMAKNKDRIKFGRGQPQARGLEHETFTINLFGRGRPQGRGMEHETPTINLEQRANLLHDLACKDPFTTNEERLGILNNVNKQVKSLSHQLHPGEIEPMTRILAFEQIASYPFPPSVTEKRNARLDNTIEEVLCSRSYKYVPSWPTLREMANECLLHLWAQEPRIAEMYEGSFVRNQLRRRIEDWIHEEDRRRLEAALRQANRSRRPKLTLQIPG